MLRYVLLNALSILQWTFSGNWKTEPYHIKIVITQLVINIYSWNFRYCILHRKDYLPMLKTQYWWKIPNGPFSCSRSHIQHHAVCGPTIIFSVSSDFVLCSCSTIQVKLEAIINVPAENQQLSFNETVLMDQNTLESYDINGQSTVQIINWIVTDTKIGTS